MRVAIVSYYAPPEPAVAAHRVLRLSRALLAAGHEVHWVTLDERRLLARDETLAAATPAAIVRHGLGGPTLASRPVARNLVEKVLRTITHKLPEWLALPDKHVEWTWRLRRQLPALARRERFDAVLLTCGPHGQLLAVPGLRRACPDLRILIDYRDLLSGNAWTQRGAERLRQRILRRERNALACADALTVNTQEALAQFQAAVGAIPCPVQVVRNAADHALADEIDAQRPRPDLGPGIHLGFFGTIFPRRRMAPVLAALARLPATTLAQVTAHVYCDARDSKKLLDEDLATAPPAVRERVRRADYVPFADALQTMRAMTALLLVNGSEPADDIFVPGKLYDYLMARRPILFVGNEGDAWRIVAQSCGAGHCFTYSDPDGLAAAIAALAPRPADLPPAHEFDAPATFAPLLDLLKRPGIGARQPQHRRD